MYCYLPTSEEEYRTALYHNQDPQGFPTIGLSYQPGPVPVTYSLDPTLVPVSPGYYASFIEDHTACSEDDPGTPSSVSSATNTMNDMAAPVANRFDQQTQGAMPSYIASQVQRPEGGSPETDTTSDSVDSTSDRGSSEPEADQPDKRLIARKAVISKAKANQHLELRELDVFLKQEKRPVAAKGAGSRGGVEGHYCQVTGCDRARTMIPRHDRALHHVAKHFGLKPSKCAKCHKGFLRGHDKDRHEKSCPGHRRTNSNRSDSSSNIAIMSPMNSVGASCHDHRGSLCPGRCRYLDMSHFCLIHVIKVVGRTLSWLTDHQLAGDSLTRSELCPPAG